MAQQSVINTTGSTISEIHINEINQIVITKAEQPKKLPEMWNVPTRNPNFVARGGKNDILTYLESQFINISIQRPELLLIKGEIGIGKTAALTEFVWKHATSFKGIAWFDYWGTFSDDSFKSFCDKVGKHIDIKERKLTSMITEIQTFPKIASSEWFEENPGWLVVFDKVDTLDCLEIPKKGAYVIVTSTCELILKKNVPVFVVKPYTEDECNRLSEKKCSICLPLKVPAQILILSSMVKELDLAEDQYRSVISNYEINGPEFCKLIKREGRLKKTLPILQYCAFIKQTSVCYSFFRELVDNDRETLQQMVSFGFLECDTEKNLIRIQSWIQHVMYQNMLEDWNNFKRVLLELTKKIKKINKGENKNDCQRVSDGIIKMFIGNWETGDDSRFKDDDDDDDIQNILMRCLDVSDPIMYEIESIY